MSKPTFQAATLAAIIAFFTVLMMGFGLPLPVEGVSWQPSMATHTVAEFIRATNEYPQLALRFFAADSLFVLSYIMVFVGLHTIAAQSSPRFAQIGLGAGVVAGIFDAAENAFFVVYATQSLNGIPLVEPALPLIYILANLKWMGAFAALYAFGLGWPKNGRFDQLLTLLMVLFPLVGVLGVAQPAWVDLRGLFFLVGMPLFAWRFWQAR